MGKRSDFKRIERDFYPTPEAAVLPLLPHLEEETRFDEPCAGDGQLVRHLQEAGHICEQASDIEPRVGFVNKCDVFKVAVCEGDMFITNPPWDRKILHPLIDHLMNLGVPVWLLFDADWMHTKQSSEYMDICEKIVSIGRVKWFPDSKMTGKDNCCWYLFNPGITGQTEFYGR